MNRTGLFTATILLVVIFGCQSSQPVTPGVESTSVSTISPRVSTNLWSYYDVEFNDVSGEFTVNELRNAAFTANVTMFLGGSPPKLGIQINNIDGDEFDLDVILTHPFPGLDQYTGFDVFGVFIGNAGYTADWNSELFYPGPDDQQLLNPDGYTRWFNPSEFHGGTPLLSYVPGSLSTPGYMGNATLMPYRYFTDGIDADEDLWTYLTDSGYSDRGKFTPTTNRRNYLLKFPSTTGVRFNYAVVANWEPNINDPAPPTSLDDFPSSANAAEAVAFNIDTDSSTLYWNSTDGGGGTLIADISILDWSAETSTVMNEYLLKISSDLFDSTYEFTTSDMTPVSSGDNYYTYHVELAPDTVIGNDQAIWVIVEYPGYDYSNIFGVDNEAGGPLTAYYRHEFTIGTNPGNQPPVIELGVLGPEDVTTCDVETYYVTASDPDMDTLTYTWSVVESGQPDDFSITGEDEDFDIQWDLYAEGDWVVNCRVSDGIESVDATPLDVALEYKEDCCPDAPNAAYAYTSTPTTSTGQWCYLDPAVQHDTMALSSIDMDFLNDDTDRLVVNCRSLQQIACVTPQLNTTGTNVTVFVTGVDCMSLDVTPDNKIVYVEFDDSAIPTSPWTDYYWVKKTAAIAGADTMFHVYDTVTSAEIGTGFDVGAKIQAVCPDEYGTIWAIDEYNEMHCFEYSGGTYTENTGRNFDMDDNGSGMLGLVFDFAIDYYNECFYILTNATEYGYLYRVECDGVFNSTIDGNPNPIENIWDETCNDRADIVIDNLDSDGNIHDGEQDAQIICVANIEMDYNVYASKIGVTRVDAALGNELWWLFEGSQNTGYGATCTAINDQTNTMYTKCGPPFGNQYIVHKFYVPGSEWY